MLIPCWSTICGALLVVLLSSSVLLGQQQPASSSPKNPDDRGMQKSMPGVGDDQMYQQLPVIHSFTLRSLNALAITETELKLMAAAAIIGFKSSPKDGKSTPAASGTPAAL